MLSLYIGVYRAVYDYQAQSDEELTLHTGDLLYLLEKSDIDDWWKVKRREVSTGDQDVEEPQGLVPSNYIEPAPVVKTAYALYDYEKQTEEELAFKEGDTFDVYDLTDPDWLLVGDQATHAQYGFVPSNYIEIGTPQTQPMQSQPIQPQITQLQPTQSTQPQSAQSAASVSAVNLSLFSPPPVHKDRTPVPGKKEEAPLPDLPREATYEQPFDINGDAGPPMPTRPGPNSRGSPPMPARPLLDFDEPAQNASSSFASASRARAQSNASSRLSAEQEHKFDGEFFTWYITEIDGRKKRGITLSVGQGLVVLSPTKVTSKMSQKPASHIDQEWKVRDLTSFSNEKKHIFFEFKNPSLSVELHAGSKDVAEAIMSIIGDIKGADSSRVLNEVAKASKPQHNTSNRKIGRLLYNFEAQGDDELQCKEGDEVYIVDETKSKDWWMVENIDTRRQGVVPLSYIEIVGSSNLDKLLDQPTRKKSVSKKSSKGRVVENKPSSSSRHRSRDEREKIREHDRIQRDKHEKERVKEPSNANEAGYDKSMPNIHRIRTWIDLSGSFKVEAEFLGCIEGKIHLHKTNGVKIAVAAAKLSMEDLEYVEKVTGSSLETYKEEVQRQILKKQQKAQRETGVVTTKPSSHEQPNAHHQRSATAAINDVAPPKPTRPTKAGPTTAVSEPDYDWFEFFLSCGIDIGNCQRYSVNFSREQMDENVLQDISSSLLRTLGLREGDILRVMKFLDTKFNRSGTPVPETSGQSSAGRLFTEVGGQLKNNSSTTEISKVDAKALPTPAHAPAPAQFEDDAWAVKPAARSSEDLLKPQSTQNKAPTPQYTGSLQDLVSIKPLEANAAATTSPASVAAPAATATAPSAVPLQPVKTGTLVQPGQQFTVQKTGGNNGFVAVPQQRTGGFIPVPTQQTGGFIPVQPTGFMPITAQPTGFMPIQATGAIFPQLSFGVVPLQTGATTFQQQKTGGAMPVMPITTFGQPQLQPTGAFVPLQTGVFNAQVMPTTSFGQVLSVQKTGPLVPTQKTGGQPTGGFMPQTSFGNQPTGGFIGGQLTGGQPVFQPQPFQAQPTTSFGTYGQPQPQPQQQFGQFGQPQPQQQFGQFQPVQQQATSFQQQPTTSFGMPQQSFGQFPPPQQQPTTSFGGQFQQQPTTSFGVPQQTFGQQPQFNQFQNQQPNVGQVTNMFQNTSISQPAFPQTSFGQQQPQFDGFNPQPLQSQPTGAGFGNAPLQSQQTGRRANLQTATADNPFGF